MADFTIYHNPKCSKSRQTLELLRGKGVEPKIIEYLKETPQLDDITKLIAQYHGDAKDFVRRKEELFKELQPSLETTEDVAKLLATHPKLLERPLVQHKDEVVFGRPPENIEKFF